MNPLVRLKGYGIPQMLAGHSIVTVHEVSEERDPAQRVCDFYWARGDRFLFVAVESVGSGETVVSYHATPEPDSCDAFFVRTRREITTHTIIAVLRNLDREIGSARAYWVERLNSTTTVSRTDFGMPLFEDPAR